MSQANTDLVRRAMRAFERRDQAAMEKLCHPDVEFDWSRRLLDSDVSHGYKGLRRVFEEVDGIFEEVVFEEEEILDFGDDILVVSTARFRGRTSGAEVRARAANIWTVRDGKIARFRFYQTKEDALADLTEPVEGEPVERGKDAQAPESGRSAAGEGGQRVRPN
jgi:ketosteroid isomerase-like protein